MAENGRPRTTDDEFNTWLESMRPFLENSNSLNYSIEQSGLSQHSFVIYEKYKLGDWFSKRVDRFRSKPGEIVNDAIVTMVRNVTDKIKRKESISKDEVDMLKFYAEKARVSQGFYVNRQETAQGKTVEEVVDDLYKQVDNINDVAENARKQMGSNDASVQNKEQSGTDSNLPAKPDPTTT